MKFSHNSRSYSGMSGKTKIIIEPVYDHLYLSRVYGKAPKNGIRMIWNFNSEGRIQSLGSQIFPEMDKIPLIHVHELEDNTLTWMKCEADYGPLPTQTKWLNRGFENLDKKMKYRSIIRYGHGMIKDFLKNTRENYIRNPFNLRENQRTLYDLVDDEEAMHIIYNISKLLPTIGRIDDEKFMIYYD
jgi:hypothetical protein